jgi:hypothetical protein
MDTRTCNSIIDYFNNAVREKEMIGPHRWMEAALFLNSLIGEEHDKYFEAEQQCARFKAALISDGDSVASATAKLEAEDIYRTMRRQKAFISQVEEFVRLAKKQATLKDNEMLGYV